MLLSIMSRTSRLLGALSLVSGLVIGVQTIPASAATVIRVPQDYPQIIDAVNAAVTGDTVLVAPGAFRYPFNVSVGITVRSEAGPTVTSIELGHNQHIGLQGGTLEGFTVLLADNSSVDIAEPGGVVRGNVLKAATIDQRNIYHALSVYQTTATLVDGNVFRDLDCNTRQTDGSAIHLVEGAATVTNNLIVGTDCIGIHLDGQLGDAEVTVVNNTIVGNTRGVVVEAGDATKVFRNNIVTGGTDGLELQSGSSPTWTNNLLHDNTNQVVGMVDPTGTDGNVAVDPAFTGSGPNPHRLTPASPAIDAGTETDAPAADLFGTSRPIDGDGDTTATTDMGAYEYGGAVGTIGGTVTARSTAEGLGDICVIAQTDTETAVGTLSISDGSYSIEVSADTYKVRFFDCLLGAFGEQWWEDTPDPGAATDLAVAAAAALSGIDAALDVVATCNGLVGTIAGTMSADTIIGTSGDDVIISFGGDDSIDARDGDDTVCAGDGDDLVMAGKGADLVLGGDGSDTILGEAGVDQLLGESGADTIDGGSGPDTIEGGDHDDTIDGGDGRDTLNGGAGDDTISGGPRPDTILGGDSNDDISGGGGADTIRGGQGDDTLRGGPGSDDMRGELGEDLMKGGSGADRLLGGVGDDVIDGGADTDTVDGGIGIDTLDLSSAPSKVVADVKANTVTGGSNDTIRNFENIIGSDFDDVLRGNNKDNWLRGRAGKDTLLGGPGADRLDGGAGADRLFDGNGDDVDFGNGGADFIMSQPGADYISGGAGQDTISFETAPRGIQMHSLRVSTGHGRDQFSVEIIRGSDFDDEFYSGSDMYGRGGNDVIRSLGEDGTVLSGGSGDDRLYGGPNGESIYGGSGNDELWGGNDDDLMYGGKGDDVLRGEKSSDLLDGGAGVDLLSGGLGDDVLLGGPGNDELLGDSQDDLLLGGPGNDLLDGGNDNDTLAGGDGNDTLLGGGGTDTASFAFANAVTVSLTGGWATGEGNDTLSSMEWLVGSEGNDVLTGSSVPNLIEARRGNDTAYGLDSSDLLIGNAGNDTLYGGNHDDLLYGDAGTDVLNGGSGSDECHGGETNTSCETTEAALAENWSGDRTTSLRDWLTTVLGAAATNRLLRYLVAI